MTAVSSSSATGLRMPLAKCVLRCDRYLKVIVGGTFGYTRFKDDGRTRKFHGGIDLCAPIGTDCYAIAAGRVVVVGKGDDFGNYVIASASLNGRKYFTVYAHLSKTLVTEGAKVQPGTVIGKTGATGNSSPAYPHLHFEVWTSMKAAKPGEKYRVNPLEILGTIPLEPFANEVIDAWSRSTRNA